MDEKLRFRLNSVDKQIEELFSIEEKYLSLKAVRDVKWAVIYSQSPDGTIKDKEAWANLHPEWSNFVKALAVAEAEFHRQKHKLELKFKAYDAEHLSFKIEKSAIERGGT